MHICGTPGDDELNLQTSLIFQMHFREWKMYLNKMSLKFVPWAMFITDKNDYITEAHNQIFYDK